MTKRGIEESLVSKSFAGTASPQRNNPTNGASATGYDQSMIHDNSTNSTNYMMDMPDVKKIKTNHLSDMDHEISSKSRVVHIRNIPPETVSNDLFQLASPFGPITKHLLVKSKGQAFIEFESNFAASQMANYWLQTTIGGIPTHMQPTIRGRHVHCQMSNHKELKTSFDNNGEFDGDRNGSSGKNIPTTNGSGENTSSTPSQVIRVVVDNLCYTVTLDALHTIFSRVGKVQKIVTFTKSNVFQALVQFSDVSASIQAKMTLDGQNMFSGANMLRIEYSKLQNLVVKYNNEKSRDYTQPGMEAGNYGAGSPNNATSSLNGQSGESDLNALLVAAGASTPLGPFGSFGGSNGQFGSGNARYGAPSILGLANTNMFGAAGLTGLALSPVIHVSGLHPEHMTPDALFTLFGVYGDVVRVKILFNKKDTALIQMAEPAQAHLAISHLDRTRLHGKTLRANSSKHQVVQMPKDSHQDSGLTKDFINSPLHRFKRPGSKNYNNIYPPSETLHVSNIPPTVTEEELKDFFANETGQEVMKFKFFPNDRRMALVQFDSIESSILALIKMHNFKVAEHSHLRVSFSKSPV